MGVLTAEPRVDDTQELELSAADTSVETPAVTRSAEAQHQVGLTLEQRIAEGRMAQLEAIRARRRHS